MALNVREWGEEGAPAILFWHALGSVGSAATLGEVAPVLAERGWRVAGLDGPGFGESPLLPPERYAVASLAALARGVADDLGLGSYVLMGHSWGGPVVLQAAADAPERVRALVLLDSGHFDYAALSHVDASRSLEEWTAVEEETASWPSVAAFEDELRAEVPEYRPALLEGYLAGARRRSPGLIGAPAEAIAAARWGLANAHTPATWPPVAAAGIPVLLLLATRDPWGAQNREHLPAFEAALPQADVRWLDGVGHDILADVGPQLGDEIADWLATAV